MAVNSTDPVPKTHLRVWRPHHSDPIIDKKGYFVMDTDMNGQTIIFESPTTEPDQDKLVLITVFNHMFEYMLKPIE